MAALINMAMLCRPLPFVEGKNSTLITFPFSVKAFHTFPIKSATPSGSPFPHHSQTPHFSMHPKGALREPFSTPPCSGGRRSGAARAGASDCAGFAPNKTQTRLSLTALSLAPCHLHKPPFSSFHRSVCFCPLALK